MVVLNMTTWPDLFFTNFCWIKLEIRLSACFPVLMNSRQFVECVGASKTEGRNDWAASICFVTCRAEPTEPSSPPESPRPLSSTERAGQARVSDCGAPGRALAFTYRETRPPLWWTRGHSTFLYADLLQRENPGLWQRVSSYPKLGKSSNQSSQSEGLGWTFWVRRVFNLNSDLTTY